MTTSWYVGGNPEPRSMGGDAPVSRRCYRGEHPDCKGSWTAYPDQGGPCECACHHPGVVSDLLQGVNHARVVPGSDGAA